MEGTDVAADEMARFRLLTLRFLHSGLERLETLQQALDEDPGSEMLRTEWVQELSQYSTRLKRLLDEWKTRYGVPAGPIDADVPVILGRITRKTPLDEL